MDDETRDGNPENLDEADEGSEFDRLAREIDENPGSPAFPRLAEAYRRAGMVERAESIAKSGLAEAPERLGGRVALALAMLDQGEITLASQELASILENVPEIPDEPAEAASEAAPTEHRLYSKPLATPSEALPHFDEKRGNTGSDEDLRQEEIDDAFDSARTEAEQMVSANQLAESAMLDVGDDTDADDLGDAGDGEDEYRDENHHRVEVGGKADESYSASDRRVFATETMASLLEEQGDLAGAERVRASIPGEAEAVESDSQGAGDAPMPAPELDLARAERNTRIINRLERWLANIRRDVA